MTGVIILKISAMSKALQFLHKLRPELLNRLFPSREEPDFTNMLLDL